MNIDRLPQPASNSEEEDRLKQSDLGQYVGRLIEESLPAQVVVDRFLGAVVANGKVMGSGRSYSLEDTAELLGAAARNRESMGFITKTNGYRMAFHLLMNNEPTGCLMEEYSGTGSGLAGRMGIDKGPGNFPGFASTDMLRGYFDVLTGGADSWNPFAENTPGPESFNPTDAEIGHDDRVIEVIEAYVESNSAVNFIDYFNNILRNTGLKREDWVNELNRSLRWLTERGVNQDIIEATAERLWDMRREGAKKTGGATVLSVSRQQS